MSDIFREVEEDVRRERLEKFWKRYSALLITLGALLLAGVGGWQLMKRHGATIAVRDSEAFAGAQRITNPTEAAKAFGTLAQNAGRETSMFAPLYNTLRPVTNPGGNGYALVAKMAQAGALFASGQLKSAVDLYREVGQSDDGEIGRAARLRAAWIIASTAPRKELEDLLAPLNTDGNTWQPLAREILAFSDYRASRIKQAADGYRALVEDERSPQALRNRARAMAAFLDGDAGSDFGAVPPTATPAPAPTALPGVPLSTPAAASP